MNDKELLEFAAKAVGILVHWDALDDDDWTAFFVRVEAGPLDGRSWHPLNDYRDGMELAARLKMNIRHLKYGVAVRPAETGIFIFEAVGVERDRDKDTLRAITRAAAEIGKTL